MKYLAMHNSVFTILVLVFYIGMAHAAESATTPTAAPIPIQKNTPALPTQIEGSQCPCNYTTAAAKAAFGSISNGMNSCNTGNTLIIKSGKAAGKPFATITIMAIDALKSEISRPLWTVSVKMDANGYIDTVPVKYCSQDLDPKVKIILNSDEQYQRCLQDIKKAVSALGLVCE